MTSSVKRKKDLKKLRKKVCKMVKLECLSLIDDPKLVCDKKSISMMTKMMSNCSHPLCSTFSFCPMVQGLTCNIVEQHGISQDLSHQLLNSIAQASSIFNT